MTARTLPVAQALSEKFPWANYRTIADIGTAQGCLLTQIVRTHPHLSGIGFDRAPLGSYFDRHVRTFAMENRLRFQSGDFLRDGLPTADVLIMGRVLHNWDLPTKRMLLNKAYHALNPSGALIVYERLIDDERQTNSVALLSSLNMLLMTEGGFDYTSADCMAWMRETGFLDIRIEPLTSDQSMVIGFKPAT
jgi:trans-aconitate methyltransferase